MSKSSSVLVRDIEIGKIYADPKTKLVIGRLKDKVIHSRYGMHQEPLFRLVFEIDEYTEKITSFNDWGDKFYEVMEPENPSLFELAKSLIQIHPELEISETIEEIMSIK
jgi:hypothetical protein